MDVPQPHGKRGGYDPPPGGWPQGDPYRGKYDPSIPIVNTPTEPTMTLYDQRNAIFEWLKTTEGVAMSMSATIGLFTYFTVVHRDVLKEIIKGIATLPPDSVSGNVEVGI